MERKDFMKNSSVFILTFSMIVFAAYSLSSYDSILSNKNKEKMETKVKTIHDFKVKSLEGKEIDFSQFKGSKILVVNTASECGFTPQYKELQELHEKMGDKVTIIGFPANNFGGQEPGTNDDIKSFCEKNYGVSFTMASKVSVKGDDQHELFEWLCSQENEDFKGKIKWNFEKFLIDENGQLMHRFRSGVSPMSHEITSKL